MNCKGIEFPMSRLQNLVIVGESFLVIILGGDVLVQRNGGLYNMMKLIYPNTDFKKLRFSSRGKKSSQRWLKILVSEVIGDQWSELIKKIILIL